jgi:hypothetical protein
MAASNPIPDGWVVATDPIAGVRAGRYVRVPVLAGHTRDETKLFPQLFAMRPDLGGVSGRLLDDAAVFALAARYDPEAPPLTTIEQWVSKAYLPASTPVTGFDARAAELDRLWFAAIRDDMLNALRSRQSEVWNYEFEWDLLPPPFDTEPPGARRGLADVARAHRVRRRGGRSAHRGAIALAKRERRTAASRTQTVGPKVAFGSGSISVQPAACLNLRISFGSVCRRAGMSVSVFGRRPGPTAWRPASSAPRTRPSGPAAS